MRVILFTNGFKWQSVLILSILVLCPVLAETVVIEIRRDVALRGLLVASLGMPSILVHALSARLLHLLE